MSSEFAAQAPKIVNKLNELGHFQSEMSQVSTETSLVEIFAKMMKKVDDGTQSSV